MVEKKWIEWLHWINLQSASNEWTTFNEFERKRYFTIERNDKKSGIMGIHQEITADLFKQLSSMDSETVHITSSTTTTTSKYSNDCYFLLRSFIAASICSSSTISTFSYDSINNHVSSYSNNSQSWFSSTND